MALSPSSRILLPSLNDGFSPSIAEHGPGRGVGRDLSIQDVEVAVRAVHAENIVADDRVGLHTIDHVVPEVAVVGEAGNGSEGGIAGDKLQGVGIVPTKQEQVHLR